MDQERLNIVMFTNTYTPHVGGVARSVQGFAKQYRQLGHRVLIVAPAFSDMPEHETDVLRVPALQQFNGSDFSLVLPVSGLLSDALDKFDAHIIHAHHPFLLGMTALRIARFRNVPLVFTHHTLYEQYTHYVPGNSPTMQQFAIALATHYGNLADLVFAPSESTARLLQQRGVQTAIEIVPTGVELERFAQGDGRGFRKDLNIPSKAFVVGHLGRLAEEKNLSFLATSVAEFIVQYQSQYGRHKKHIPKTCFLLIGTGPAEELVVDIFHRAGLSKQLFRAGTMTPDQLADAYDAMDVFAFASKSETQGMVISEAMACGVPVVALDASGTRELIVDQINGRLLNNQCCVDFAEALQWIARQPALHRLALSHAARKTAEQLSMAHTADQALHHYRKLIQQKSSLPGKSDHLLRQLLDLIKTEWMIIEGIASAAGGSIVAGHSPHKLFADH